MKKLCVNEEQCIGCGACYNSSEELFEMMNGLFDVLVVKSRPKNGQVTIRPFELLWENKNDLKNLYGNINTKEFFLQELLDNMKPEDEEDKDENLPELPHTEKKQLEDVQEELPNVIHKEFGYFDYSTLDKSNDRFIRKQESTNSLREQIFVEPTNEENEKEEHIQTDLFEEAPF